jgi:hypothetical protein
MAQSASERRAAQRRLAKEIHSGTYVPSKIGAKARGDARKQLRELIYDLYGDKPRYSEKGVAKTVKNLPDKRIKHLVHTAKLIKKQKLDWWQGRDLIETMFPEDEHEFSDAPRGLAYH